MCKSLINQKYANFKDLMWRLYYSSCKKHFASACRAWKLIQTQVRSRKEEQKTSIISLGQKDCKLKQNEKFDIINSTEKDNSRNMEIMLR